MDSEATIKAALVFAVTLGMFVFAKQGASTGPSSIQSTSTSVPIDSSVASGTQKEDPIAPRPSSTAIELPAEQPSQASDDKDPPNSFLDVTADVNQALSHWKEAMVSNDSKLESSCYAPSLASYFSHLNVDNAFVQSDKQSSIDQGNRIISFDVKDVRLEDETASSATVRLMKDETWKNINGVQIERKTPTRVTFEKLSDGWKITSEQNWR